MAKADIGLIGLAVMGGNLALNMASHGFTVAVWSRTLRPRGEFHHTDWTGRGGTTASTQYSV